MIKMLHEDTHFRLEHSPSNNVYRVARSKVAFKDLGEVERAYDAIVRAVSALPAGATLLLDVRDAPPRNDPAFEEAVARVRDRIFRPFARVAVLVQSAAGRLQVQRLNKGLPKTVAVFDDEDRAFDHLLG